jgi:polyisoprenoid-binding protein YceI
MSATVYDIDPAHSSAHFSVRHMMITNVRGEFTKVSGTVTFDPDNPGASQVEATIDVASLHTREEQRDAHLKSADFFDVAKFPEIKFVSKSVERLGDGEHSVKGDLTIHGVTKEVTFRVDGPTRNQRSMGQYESRRHRNRQDQSQGFRPCLERGAGNRRRAGRRTGIDQPGSGVSPPRRLIIQE